MPTKTLRIAGSVAGSEIVAASTAMGAIWALDKLAPSLLDALAKPVAKHIIQPRIEKFDKMFDSIGHTSGHDHHEDPKTHSEDLAKQAIKLFVGATVGTITSNLVEHSFDKALGVKQTKKAVLMGQAAEIVTQLGAAYIFNTKACDRTNEWVRGVKKTLTNVGVSEQTAEDWSNICVRWELPNAIGAVARIGTLRAALAGGNSPGK